MTVDQWGLLSNAINSSLKKITVENKLYNRNSPSLYEDRELHRILVGDVPGPSLKKQTRSLFWFDLYVYMDVNPQSFEELLTSWKKQTDYLKEQY